MDIQSIIDIPKSTLEAAGLNAGDLLRVKVAELEESGRVLVEIGRWRVSADIRFPVAAGDTLLVRVTNAGNRLSLQLIQRTPAEEPIATSAATGPVRANLQPLLSEIRSAQEQLARQAQTSEPFHMVHLTLPLTEERAAASLKIAFRSRRRTGTAEGHRASLLLTLERIGAVRADLLLLQRSLTVGVYVSDASARDWVEQHLRELRNALAPLFENVGVQVSVSPARIEQFATEDYRPAGEGQVDVRV